MNSTVIKIDLHGPDISKWMDDIARRQIPFAMSKALNEVGKAAGIQLVRVAKQNFTIRNKWSGRYARGSISAGENFVNTDGARSAAYFSTQAHYKTPIAKMRVRVYSKSWQIMQQTADAPSQRDPNFITTHSSSGKKISYIAIPIKANVSYASNGRLKPNAQVLISNPIKHRAFVIDAGNTKILCQRYGSGANEYKALYILVDRVKITPKFNFNEIVNEVYNKLFGIEFDKAMKWALAHPKKT